MPSFKRCEPQFAGPAALGILVPPGARTLVILRPRSLDWDLLPARWDGDPARAPTFCTFGRDDAAQVARRVLQGLIDAVMARNNPVETIGDPKGHEFQVWVRCADLCWIVCKRQAGRGYEPLLLASHAAAQRVGEALTPIVWPALEAQQEYYFNTQKFM